MKLFNLASDEAPPSISVRVVSLSIVFAMTALSTLTFHSHVAESFTWLFGFDMTSLEEQQQDAVARQEVLWFARALYSESKRSDEQRLIAWVIRNRVESPHYPDTYKEVVLQKKQFSGLNAYDENYELNVTRTYESTGRGWDSALAIAEGVYNAPDIARLIPSNVRHFYSPHAVRSVPEWAEGNPAQVVRDPNKGYVRFAFHADVQ